MGKELSVQQKVVMYMLWSIDVIMALTFMFG